MQPATTECLCPFFSGKTVIVGIGNDLRGDDGFGPVVVESLGDHVRAAAINAGNAPENYLGTIAAQEPDVVLLVDAADFGGRPGEIALFDPDDLLTTSFSTHMPALSLIRTYLSDEREVRVVLLAAQPGSTELGEPLSEQMCVAVDETVAIIEAADAAVHGKGY